jgi:dihydrodipicolinate synthase/N-acetylneuraminate lyase
MRRFLAIAMGFASCPRRPLVVSSGHTGTDADGLLHYFAEISEAVSIPIMVQDTPPGT